MSNADRRLVPDSAELVTIDLSYLSVAAAVPQLGPLDIPLGADLVALVKPTFELRRPDLAGSDEDVEQAVAQATAALRAAGWAVAGSCPAPRTGRRGAREVFVHARSL